MGRILMQIINTKHFEVIDNFLPKITFDNIKNKIISETFPFYYNKNVTFRKDIPNESFYFTHLLYNNNVPNSDFFNLVTPLLNAIDIKALIRVKCNMYPNTHEHIKHEYHKDYDFYNKSAILYLNTNNGPTYFKDGTKVDAIENRLLKFDGNVEHCSSSCTDEKIRVNININYL